VVVFANRVAAGRELAGQLGHLVGQDLVVLGLPRGGVPVACEVAGALGAPLDVIVVRKVGVPFQRELAMGAVGEGGVRVVNERVCQAALVGPDEFAAAAVREQAEVDRRARRFRGGRPPVPIAGRVAVVVDDGIATGATARAACRVARAHGAARVVLAVPVAARDTPERMRDVADEVVCLRRPRAFGSVGRWYLDFGQVSDAEVVALLELAARERQPAARFAGADDPQAAGPSDPPARDEEITVPVGALRLVGRLTVPHGASGLVVFAHGSGSSRHSPRNRYVAAVLTDAGLATLLFDLLTPAEEPQRARVFDVPLLAGRLTEVTRQVRPAFDWVAYFGASTGSAAALWAAAEPDADIAAVVSRGGRPDLAAPRLAAVHAPTLLIVGGHDPAVLDLNRHAQTELSGPAELVVIPGATHLFQEPGTLEAVAGQARDWFLRHGGRVPRSGRPGCRQALRTATTGTVTSEPALKQAGRQGDHRGPETGAGR
jgi:putative phosphoribosyl transferase